MEKIYLPDRKDYFKFQFIYETIRKGYTGNKINLLIYLKNHAIIRGGQGRNQTADTSLFRALAP